MARKIYLTEKQFKNFIGYIVSENVYVKDVNNRKKTAQLTYNNLTFNKGTKNAADYLKTDKMNKSDGDTYEVTLKGGLVCYNITSISGEETMHYFKNKWGDNKKATMTLTNSDTNQRDQYDLTMLTSEEKEFLAQFTKKVGFVVNYCENKFKSKNPNITFNGISIYPVPSSSNFNKKMANLLQQTGLYDMPCIVINNEILKKNFENVVRDEDFINKNRDFYNSEYYKDLPNNKTSVTANLDKELNRMHGIAKAQSIVGDIDELAITLISQMNNYHTSLKQDYRNNSRMIKSMVNNYKRYYDLISSLSKLSEYENPLIGKNSKAQRDEIAMLLKYSKGPSIEKRSSELWAIVKPYVRGEISSVTGKPYTQIELARFSKTPFEIKTLSNPQRMALKNIYIPNTEKMDLIKQELEKIKGTMFVIFDDNISGGSTLSDICYQFQKLGIQNIVPITFGEMNEKWTVNFQALNKPSDLENGHVKWNY